jgi:hypothetical protein
MLLSIKLPEKKQDENYKKYNSVVSFNSNKNMNKVDLLGFEELDIPEKEICQKYLQTKLSHCLN